MKKWVQILLRLQVRFYFVFIGVALLAGYLSLAPTGHLFQNVRTSFSALLPADHPTTLLSNRLNKKTDNSRNLGILFETTQGKKLEREFPSIAEKLSEIEGITDAGYKKPAYDFLDQHKLYFMKYEDLTELRDEIDRRIQKEKLGKLFVDLEEEEKKSKEEDEDGSLGKLRNKYLERFGTNIKSPYLSNKEGTMYIMNVTIKAEIGDDIKKSKKMLKRFENFFKDLDLQYIDPEIKIYYGGGLRTVVDEYDALIKDLQIAGWISGGLIYALQAIHLRNIFLPLFVLFPMAISLLINFAIAAHTVGELNLITSFLFMILFGLGDDIGTHYVTRYKEEKLLGKNLEDSLLPMMTSTGKAAWSSAVTMGSIFFLLKFNEFRGFSDFGFIAGVGLLLAFLCYMLLFPSLITFGEKFHLFSKIKNHESIKSLGVHQQTFFNKKFKLALVLITILSVAFGIFGSRFEYDISEFNNKPQEARVYRKKSLEVYPAKTAPAVILANNAREASQIAKILKEKKDRGELPLVESINTYVDVLPADQEKKQPILEQIRKLLDDDIVDAMVKNKEDREDIDRIRSATKAKKFQEKDIPEKIRESFFGKYRKGDEQFVFVSLKKDVSADDGRHAMALAGSLREIKTPNGTIWGINNAVVFGEVLHAMFRDNPKVVTLAFFSILIFLYLDLRSWKKVFIVYTPLIIGISWTLAAMVMLGWQWNLFNIVALPLLLGLGISHSIHLFHRIEEEGIEAWPHILTQTGFAIFMTTLTTMAGFTGMLFAQHKGLRSLASVATLGLFITMISAFVILPLLCKSMTRKGGH